MTAPTSGRGPLQIAMGILGIGTEGRIGNSRVVLLILGFVLSFGASGAYAQCTATPGSNNINWTDTSGNWSLASNWNLGCTPNNGTPSGTSYNVTINGTGSDTVTLDISPTVNSLTLGTGETLQLTSLSGVALNDLGSFDNSGSLMFSATSNGSSVTTGAFTNNGGASVNMNGQGDTLTASSFTNSGAMTVTGQVCCGGLASETLNDSGDFSNNSGGSLTFSAESVFNQATVTGTFTNAAGANLNMLGEEDTLSVGSLANSGTITMAGADEILNDSGDLTNSSLITLEGSGDQLVATGAFTNSGTVNLTGGGVFATSIANSGAINLEGTDDLVSAGGGTFDNTGSVTFGSGSSSSEIFGATVFTNENGATVSIDGANDILTAGSFVNSGVFTLNGSAPFVQLAGDFTNNSTGSLTFSSTSVGGLGSGIFVAGTFANNGGAVTMSGNGDNLYAGSYTNTGTILLNGVDETIGSNGSTTTFENTLGGTITFGSGSTDNTVSMSGAFTNDRNSTVTMNGTGDLLYGSALTNSGAIVIGGNMETLGAYGTGDVTNNLVGTITFGSGSTGSFVGTNGSFTNAGTLTMNGSGDQVSGGSFTNSGVISVGGNLETLVTTGGAFTNSGSLTFTSSSTGSYAETASAFTNSGTITMNGIGDEVGGGSFTNTGVISIGGNTETLVSSTSDFNNNGSLTFASTSTGSKVGTFGGAFTNTGSVAMSGTGDTLSAGSFTNSGSVMVGSSETLNAVGGYTQNGAGSSTDVSGTLATTGTYQQNAGNVTVAAGGVINSEFFVVTGGTVTMAGGVIDPTSVSISGGANLQGTGTIQGSVSMTGGTMTPAAAGGADMLTIDGSFSQSGASFDELIGATGNGLLTVGGPLTLGSSDTLNIDLLDGFTPSDDKLFDILNYTGGESGSFANAAPGDFDMDGWVWDISYDYDNEDEVVLEALTPEVSTPEPGELLLLAVGLLALSAFYRRKRVELGR